MAAASTYDYVVIGSGAGGAAAANRLSADPGVRVLVLEAGGPDSDPNIPGVGGFVRLWGSALDWTLNTEAQPGLAGRQITINQGKVVGGGTAINAMMYVRGNRRNFDQWAAMGADGWGYADVLPTFKALEDYEGGASEYRGVGGPISVRDCPEAAMRSDEFLNSAVEAGFDGPRWDYNGARQENGAGFLQFHIGKDGQRCGAAAAFLDPVCDRMNLTLETEAEVARILIEGKRAVGVEYQQNGQRRQARAAREIILASGALQSPKLLMLSGVGPADALRKHNIPVVADLPGVGRNLQDHVQLPVVFRTKSERPSPELLTGNVLFTNTRKDAPDAPPDLQLNFTPAVPRPLSAFLNFGGPACIFLAILVQPKSVGEVSLRSADPQDPSVINPKYLQDPADYQTLASALRLIRDIAGTKAFADLNAGEIAPGAGDPEGFIRSQASTLWHPAGTCKIGRGPDAVVDPMLRVHGVQGLRVADASVMPTVPSGNTVASCFMIGARAADMIRAG